MKHIKVSFYLILICLLFGCGKSAKQIDEEKALIEAKESLNKLSAATEVGLNYQAYGNLLIDAKAKVNNANDKLTDEKVKTVLNQIMNAYIDANQFWGAKIKNQHWRLTTLLSDGKTIAESKEKYNLNTMIGNQGIETVDNDDAMQKCWAYARLYLGGLEQMISESRKR